MRGMVSDYSIGQVLYVVMSSEHCILPVQVVEEIIKKTLSKDTQYTYMVQTTDGNVLNLSEMNGDVFETIEMVKSNLIDKVVASISKIVSDAEASAVNAFGVVERQDSRPEQEQMSTPDAQDDQLVKLPDGTIARLKVSTNTNT
jgi:hypothetical protein